MAQITKIYELRTIGFETVDKQLDKLYQDFLKISKVKADLNAQKTEIVNVQGMAAFNQQLQEASINQGKVTESIKETITERTKESTTNNNSVQATNQAAGAYLNLNQQYKQAKINLQDLAASGIASKEELEAATLAANSYKQQLLEINALIKNRPVAPVQPAADIPLSTTETTENINAQTVAIENNENVIEEWRLKEAEASNTAVQLGQANLQASENIKISSASIKESAADISTIQTKYEEYTGTLRQNVLAQLENETALTANRSVQKEITKEITQTGITTEQQRNKLASLREEEELLVESNKALTVTIRNQAKEYIASVGSLDEMQAQLNQLQQAYENLSAIEKTQPFGVKLKAEIDSLEPSVKALEAELGKFSRNVGNYPTVFTGAFKVLENEIDVVKGKLVSGNFGGKQLDDLVAKEKVLTSQTNILEKQFTSSVAQTNAYKEAARQLGLQFGTDSEIFKNFTTQVGLSTQKIEEANIAVQKSTAAVATSTQTSTNKVGGFFTKFYSGIRQLANFIPGLGISGIVLLLIAPLESFGAAIVKFVKDLSTSKGALVDLKKIAEETAAAFEGSSQAFVDASTNVSRLKQEVDLAKQGFLNKDQVIKDYNESLGKTIGTVKDLDGVEQALVKNGPAYIQMMFLKSAANFALEKAAKSAFEAEQNRRKKEQEFQTIATNASTFAASGTTAPGFVPGQNTIDAGLKARAEAAKKAKDEAVNLADESSKEQLSIAEKFQKDAADIAKKNKFDFFAGTQTEKTKTVNTLKKQNTDILNVIESNRKVELALEEKRVVELQLVHQFTLDEERKFAENTADINLKYLDQKIAYLESRRKLSSQERLQLAEFGKERVDIELKTQKTLEDINKRDFDQQSTRLKNQLDEQIKNIQERNKIIQDDPTISATVKAEAKITADKQILDLQVAFNVQEDKLEKALGIQSLKNAKESADAIRNTKKELLADELKLTEAGLKDAQSAGEKSIAQFKEIIARARLENENSTKNQSVKERTTVSLDREEKIGILAREVGSLQTQLPIYKQLLSQKKITDTEYLNFITTLENKQKELAVALGVSVDDAKNRITGVADFIKRKLADVLNIKVDSAQGQLLAETLTQSYNLAAEAMASYFDQERANIERSNQVNQRRIDLERDQRLARSQSADEAATIEHQAQLKRDASNKEAFEKNKKIQIAQAKINLATQLSNLAVIAFAPTPPNVLSLGAFGQIMYAIQAAIAFANYSLNVGRIRSATFGFGGMLKDKFSNGGQPDMTTIRGGKVKGRTHEQSGNKFIFKGRVFEDEVEELNIIRTKNAPKGKKFNITGTQEQIASALNEIGGGIRFAPGAKVNKFQFGGTAHTTEKQSTEINNLVKERTAQLIVNNTFVGTDYRDDISYLSKLSVIVNKQIDEKIAVATALSRYNEVQELTNKKIENTDYTINKTNEILENNAAIENRVEAINRIVERRSLNVSETDKQAYTIIGSFNKLSFVEKNATLYDETISQLHNALLSYKQLNNLSADELSSHISEFRRIKFGYGGSFDTTTTRGGIVGGRSHAKGGNPFIFKGRVFEDEVDELNIIRTKDVRQNVVHTIKGTHTQIASMLNKLGGGIEFKRGAKLLGSSKFEAGGALGYTMQAPVFTPSSGNSTIINNNGTDMSDLVNEFRNFATETSKRFDRIQVEQVTSTVTKAQARQVRQQEISTL